MTEGTQQTLSQDEKIRLREASHRKQITRLLMSIIGLISVGLISYALYTAILSGISTGNSSVEIPTHPQLNKSESVNAELVREELKAALAEFERSIQPYLDNSDLSRWAKSGVVQLKAEKEDALSDFALGKYAQALKKINRLSEATLETVRQWNSAFDEQMDNAQLAFRQERINLSKVHLNKAYDIKPDAEAAQRLESRIHSYAKVSEFIKEYEVGLVENNLEKQVEALSSALMLDPLREELKPILSEASSRLSLQKLNEALAVADQALLRQNYSRAEDAYRAAYHLFPNDKAVSALRAKLDSVNKQSSLDDALKQAKQLASSDQWVQLTSLTNQKLILFPDSKALADYKKTATEIIRVQKSLNAYIARPERLTDSGIRDNAKSALKSAIPFMVKSPSLAKGIKQLGGMIRAMEVEISLTITSDNKTHIVVKGVGIIGQTHTKTVALAPGSYTLEATRQGYRSKMISVVLSPKQVPQKIHLVCDQKI